MFQISSHVHALWNTYVQTYTHTYIPSTTNCQHEHTHSNIPTNYIPMTYSILKIQLRLKTTLLNDCFIQFCDFSLQLRTQQLGIGGNNSNYRGKYIEYSQEKNLDLMRQPLKLRVMVWY